MDLFLTHSLFSHLLSKIVTQNTAYTSTYLGKSINLNSDTSLTVNGVLNAHGLYPRLLHACK